jgi:hypothetical protein
MKWCSWIYRTAAACHAIHVCAPVFADTALFEYTLFSPSLIDKTNMNKEFETIFRVTTSPNTRLKKLKAA